MNFSNANLTSKAAAAHEELVEALVNMNCGANLVERTRRATRVAAITLEEQRVRQRRNLGFAILALLSLLIMLSPVLWSGVEDMVSGEHFADLPMQVAFLLLMLFPAMLAALIVVWKGQRSAHHDGRG